MQISSNFLRRGEFVSLSHTQPPFNLKWLIIDFFSNTEDVNYKSILYVSCKSLLGANATVSFSSDGHY